MWAASTPAANSHWNVVGAYSFTFAVRNGVTYSGLLGYRALSVDYEKGSGVNRYEFDVVQHGLTPDLSYVPYWDSSGWRPTAVSDFLRLA